MKTKFFIYIVFNCFILFNSFTYSQEEIPWEVKQRLINKLDSADVRGVIASIEDYNVIDAKEKIEQVFWNTNFTRSEQYGLLKLLYKFGSNLTQKYALAYIDTLEINPFGNSTLGLSVLYYQVSASEILMKLGDYSKASLVFEYLQYEYPKISQLEISILSRLLNNIPQYYEAAKIELVRAVQEAFFYRDRYYALEVLYNHNQQETIPLMKQMFVEDEDPTNRLWSLDTLTVKHKDEEIHTLLKQRLSQDPDFYLRYKIAMKLLYSFGYLSDYKFVADYLPSEQNAEIKEGLLINMSAYKPRKPDSSASITDLLTELVNMTDTANLYTWLGDLNFSNELKSILITAKTNLLEGDSLACRIQVKAFQDLVDNVYKDSLNSDPRFVTIEGWKFLYWNAQYILDRLPKL
ncbi:MAG: HEAT repeat domain-containing protein [Ignavibacteriaceae bacterium]